MNIEEAKGTETMREWLAKLKEQLTLTDDKYCVIPTHILYALVCQLFKSR